MSPPRQLGPYEVVRKLGAGTTASTYLAIERADAGTKLLVCLKVPHAALGGDRHFLRAFLGEAEIVAKLHHPNIVQLEGVERAEGGLPYLVLDFVEGMDLAELIAAVAADHAQLDWTVVVYVAQAIARALEHAHEDLRGSGSVHDRSPIVHRDLAPSNVLLGRMSGTVYVTDFGLALAMDRAWVLASGQRGRIGYSAPEYLRGEPYDTRADLYSVGVILFEALTGRRPYTAAYMHERNRHLEQIDAGARANLEALRYELHPSFGAPPPGGLVELVRITEWLLEPKPRDRLPSAAELVDALGAIAIPSNMDRVLREVVQRYQPAARRSILVTTGDHPIANQPIVNEWSATNPEHLERHFEHPSVGRERDRIHVTDEGAARLMAAFAHESNQSLDETLAAFEATDPDRPAVDPTDPDRPALDATALESLARGECDLVPMIPITRPSQPIATTAFSSAASRFAETQYDLPAFDLAEIERRARWAPRVAALAALVAVTSVFAISTASSLLAPLMTGQLGYYVIDGFWTPLFTYGGLAGLVLALVLASAAFALWKSPGSSAYR